VVEGAIKVLVVDDDNGQRMVIPAPTPCVLSPKFKNKIAPSPEMPNLNPENRTPTPETLNPTPTTPTPKTTNPKPSKN
jgi:hypothetical protein